MDVRLVILIAIGYSQVGYTPPMKFRTLQDNLRKALWQRIDEGDLTGLHLAAQTGFKQANISNFLNRKRGLSLEGMDKDQSVQNNSVLDLLDSYEVIMRTSFNTPSTDDITRMSVSLRH